MTPKKSLLKIKKKSIATAFDSVKVYKPKPSNYDYDADFIPMDWPEDNAVNVIKYVRNKKQPK